MRSVESVILFSRELPMATETLINPEFARRSSGSSARTELPRIVPIEYPDSDGQPMAESDFQFEPLSYAVQSLKVHFQSHSDVYVAGNIFFYYEEGEPTEVVAPDVLVVIGAENRKRRSYKLWEEPKAPDFVLEITSNSTRGKDQGSKKALYQYLGVTEYFCYDPTGDYLDPPLVGYRLEEGRYVSIAPQEATPTSVVVASATLGLVLRVTGREFRFVDPATGNELLNLAETEWQRHEEQRLRLEAEARVRELEAQLAALKRGET